MKKAFYLVLFVILLGILNSLSPIRAWAAEASPSADLQTKIKALESEIASKAATLKQQINQKLDNKSYSGKVTSKSDTQLALDSGERGSKTIIINDYTVYEYSSKKLSKKIDIGDFISALGDVDDKNVLTAKKIVKMTPPDNNPLQFNWGKVISTSSNTINVLGKGSRKLTLEIDKNTTFKSGNEEASINDVRTGQYFVSVATKDSSGSLNSRFIYLIPSAGAIKILKTASPSATPSASAKAKSKQSEW